MYTYLCACPTILLQVTVKSSALQLLPEHRKSLITALVPALQACFPGLLTDRVTTMFEELPVENIAIGTYISIFGRRSTSSRPVDWDTEGPSPH